MAATVNTGWRNVTPGPCSICGMSDDYECDGRGTVYCSCECCGSCGEHEGHAAGCPDDHSDCEDCDECGATPDSTHWSYGSGSVGCLYDHGPCFAETKEAAIDGALFIFSELPEAELEQARANLDTNGIHYFSDRGEAGADYVEIDEHEGPCPDDDA